MTKKILILHDLSVGSRRTNRDHIYNFPKYEKGNLYVFHAANAPVSEALKQFKFDGVIMNYCFLGYRAGPLYPVLREKYAWLKDLDCPKIAICQDDYTESGVMDEWLEFMDVSTIYSPIQNNVKELYPRNWGKKNFKLGLTAYTDSADMKELAKYARPFHKRQIDVGTRVRFLPPQFGRYGRTKGETAEDFAHLADIAGFNTDISTDPSDVIFGSNWLKFVGNCKFTLGSKGGSSLNDPYGKFRKRITKYLQECPNAGFAEVEKKCFPGVDGHFVFAGVSPRLFEAAALRTCQILIRDEYVGGIEPYIDYIPLDEDMSNIEEVFTLMRDEDKCLAMIESCYQKLIASEAFDYNKFVPDVLSEIIPLSAGVTKSDAKLLEQHFSELRPYLNIKRNRGGFFGRLWQRSLANAAYADLREHAASLFSLPTALASSPSASNYLLEECQSNTVMQFLGENIAIGAYLDADLTDMQDVANLVVDHGYSFTDLETWWDMCEYVYEPQKPVTKRKPRTKKKKTAKARLT